MAAFNTVYFSSQAATTITTANQFYTVLGSPATTGSTTQLGTATGWGELWSQGNVGAWAGLGSIGSPTGHGFLLDNTSLVGTSSLAGVWEAIFRLTSTGTGAVTITADLHCRAFKYNGGTYTLIAEMIQGGQWIPTSINTFNPTAIISSTTNFVTGDKLYVDVWLNVTGNTGAVSTQTIQFKVLSTDTVGQTGASNGQITYPGSTAPTTPTINSYGASLDSGGSDTAAGLLFSGKTILNALVDSQASVARYQIAWKSIERAVMAQSQTAVNAAGSVALTMSSVPANFVNGASVLVDVDGANQETVTLTGATATTITATFTKTHTTVPFVVAIVPNAGDTPSSSGSPARVQAYDWTTVDDYVQACQMNGIAISFVLQNPPAWHYTPLSIDSSSNVPVATDSATFVTALLARYPANTFYSFEIGNEGFNTGLLTSGNAATMFGQAYNLLNAVTPVVRSSSPKTLVGAPAELNKQTANVSAWTTGFFSANSSSSNSCATLVDFCNFHAYLGSNPDIPASGNVSFNQWWQAYQSAMATAGLYLPLWVTEFNWNIGTIGDVTYNTWLTTILTEAIASKRLYRMIHYDLDSIVPNLHFNDGSTNQSYKTWKNFIQTSPNFPTGREVGRIGTTATIIGNDTFIRANQSGWGNATDGQTWNLNVGSGTLSISANEGVIVSAGADTDVQLGTANAADVDLLVRFSVNTLNDITGIQGRYSVSGGKPTCYKFLFYSGQFHINKSINGIITNLTNAGSQISTNTYYWLRFRVQGTSLSGRYWPDGTSEPPTWTTTTTDSSISGAGGIALLGNTGSGSAGVHFDHFTATNYTGLSGSTGVNVMRLGTQTLADVEASVRLSVFSVGDTAGITLRDQGLSQYYRLQITATQTQIIVQTPTGGVVTLATYGFTITAGTSYWLKFRVIGTTLYGKIWPDGTAEPRVWLLSTTDSSNSGAGQVGLAASLVAVGDTVSFDTFLATAAATNTAVKATNTFDSMMRAGIQARSGIATRDAMLRARLVDLSQNAVAITTYAAKRPPLVRKFPKS